VHALRRNVLRLLCPTALCDRLDAAITSRDETVSRYAEAVVQQLSAACALTERSPAACDPFTPSAWQKHAHPAESVADAG
jgi:hypothetical protein